jgi:hypothetical protein
MRLGLEIRLAIVGTGKRGEERSELNTRTSLYLSELFIGLSVVGVGGAIYHAWSEKAFTTNLSLVQYAPLASFFGVPYWVFGLIWYPLILVVGLLGTGLGRRTPLSRNFIFLLSVGNVFTAYMWYLDIVMVKAYYPEYIFLYSINYALTLLVVAQNWSDDVIRGFAYGTVIGGVLGAFFGPYGLVGLAVFGGVFGALRNYAQPREQPKVILEAGNR